MQQQHSKLLREANLQFHNNTLYLENIKLIDLAKEYGTPLYVYSWKTIKNNFLKYLKTANSLFNSSLICYAVKANSNIAILKNLANLGSGFDIVSGNELQRVLRAGGEAKKVVFSGVGKTISEIQLALQHNIKCFNIESVSELKIINQIAQDFNLIAPISIRVNPNIDAKSHPYISTGLKEGKFGIDIEKAEKIYLQANKLAGIKIVGLDCHLGSQIIESAPFLEAIKKLKKLITALEQQQIRLEHLDLGGGLGMQYYLENNNEKKNPKIGIVDHVRIIAKELTELKLDKYQIIFEPGKSIVANSGILITQVLLTKSNSDKNFAIVDAAMNDLIRPALYQEHHEIINLNNIELKHKTWDIVGPVCETGDFLAKQRNLSLQSKDCLAILSAGAYGMSMSSNYNSRPRAAEILLKEGKAYLIKKRENFQDLIKGEYYDL